MASIRTGVKRWRFANREEQILARAPE
jgi:hypothetical protein